MPTINIPLNYKKLQKLRGDDPFSKEIPFLITRIYKLSIKYLRGCSKHSLISQVSGKTYISFESGGKSSRAVNVLLYDDDFNKWRKLRQCMHKDDFSTMTTEEVNNVIYTIAISFCAFIDLTKSRDQQTPGTFFHYLISFFMTWRLQVPPKNTIEILKLEDSKDKDLQTDLIFEIDKRIKFHVPVKTSTRERAIMLWAHQKLLDGVYGIERFMGTAVLLAETKKGTNDKVSEIWTKGQWCVYQSYIARLRRVYYLDPPYGYEKLIAEAPPVVIKPFADFLIKEWNSLLVI